MNPGLVLGMLALVAAVLVIAVATATWSSVRRPWRLSCPRDGRDARVQVGRAAAVRAELFGGERRIARCSLWPVLACGEGCLDTPVPARQSVGPGETLPWTAERRTILVPLDGTRASEAVLPTASALARSRGARVRLLRVMPPVTDVTDDDGRVIAFADQATASVEADAHDYLHRVEHGLEGCDVDTAVRFGDPAAEILHEAEGRDVAFIAMAARHRGWLRRSVTARVAREAWVPVIRTTYGTAPEEEARR